MSESLLLSLVPQFSNVTAVLGHSARADSPKYHVSFVLFSSVRLLRKIGRFLKLL